MEHLSFLHALADIQPPNKAGQILESIPMMRLSQLEWRITQWIHLIWMIIHFLLMILVTVKINTSNSKSSFTIIVGSLVTLYATNLFITHCMVQIAKIPRLIRRRKMKNDNKLKFVKDSIKEYEKIPDEKAVSSLPRRVFGQIVFNLELMFAFLAWAVFIPEILNLDMSDYVWIEGLFLLVGWLMLLIPMTSFDRVYKLISVLEYIIIYDMVPWLIIYIIISTGFASAIKLEFDQLPSSSNCTDGQKELTGFLHKTGEALFELVIMTSGLDSDLKHVRNLECIFENNSMDVHFIRALIIFYALISAVVLLNMLIAIMSNTVTEAQQDKGWRQYQVRCFKKKLMSFVK